MIVGDDDLVGVEHVDAIAVLAIAAAAPVYMGNTVGHDDGAVRTTFAAPDADACIAAPIDAIAGDEQAPAVGRVDGRVTDIAECAVADGERGVKNVDRD